MDGRIRTGRGASSLLLRLLLLLLLRTVAFALSCEGGRFKSLGDTGRTVSTGGQ